MGDDTFRVPLEDVESSLFSGVGYDLGRRILSVRFHGGAVYQYGNIPEDLAIEFRSALSLGHFYGDYIKGRFPAMKMTGECSRCGDIGWIGDRCLDCGCAVYAEPIRHLLVVDHPSASSKRTRMAECGAYFPPAEFAKTAKGVTCSKCLAAVEKLEAAEI